MWPGSCCPSTQPSTVLAAKTGAQQHACGRARAVCTHASLVLQRSLFAPGYLCLQLCGPCPGLLPFPPVLVCRPITISEPGAGSCAASWPPLSHASLEPPGKACAGQGSYPGAQHVGGSPYPPEPRAVPSGVGQAGALRRLAVPLCWLQSWEGALWAGTVGYRGQRPARGPQPQPLSSPVS